MGTTMRLPVFDNDADTDVVVEALRRTGAAVVRNMLDTAAVDVCAAELRAEFDARGKHHKDDFSGYRTLRCSSVLGYAPSTA